MNGSHGAGRSVELAFPKNRDVDERRCISCLGGSDHLLRLDWSDDSIADDIDTDRAAVETLTGRIRPRGVAETETGSRAAPGTRIGRPGAEGPFARPV
jgi:hypothetical protein